MKLDRQSVIKEIISTQVIETQNQLMEALAARGIRSTQATVSRDIRELRLTKIQRGSKQVYAALTENKYSTNNKIGSAYADPEKEL